MKKYTVGDWIIRNEVFALSIRAPLVSSSDNTSYVHFKLQFDEETQEVGPFNTRYSFEYEQDDSDETELRGIFTTKDRKLVCTVFENGENAIELTDNDLYPKIHMVNIPIQVIDILFKIGNQEEDTIDNEFRTSDPEESYNNSNSNNGSVKERRRVSRKTRRRQARK